MNTEEEIRSYQFFARSNLLYIFYAVRNCCATNHKYNVFPRIKYTTKIVFIASVVLPVQDFNILANNPRHSSHGYTMEKDITRF